VRSARLSPRGLTEGSRNSGQRLKLDADLSQTPGRNCNTTQTKRSFGKAFCTLACARICLSVPVKKLNLTLSPFRSVVVAPVQIITFQGCSTTFSSLKRSGIYCDSWLRPPRAQDRARILFDCRMANDPAMMSSTVETNTSSHHFCRPALADVCAAQRKRTQSSPVCGLCPRTVLHHAQLRRRKATCLADDLHRCAVRSGRKHPVAASEKG
jgi:hypothetical protein